MTTFATPSVEIARDRFGRPMVVPPEGGKPVPYTRCTTFIDCLEDKYNLQQWEKRMVALGLAARPALVLAINAHRDDKDALNGICADAKEAAAASSAATTGTAVHALTELVDRGQPLPEGLPANILAMLQAYTKATAELKATHIEQFCVLDTLKVGGTPDRVVTYKRKRYIADLKTGSIEFGALKIAMQLAVYSRSKTYDIATGVRGMHNAEVDKGLIIHLPVVEDPKDAVCTLLWVDLLEGWNGVLLARQIRDKRKLKLRDLATPFEGSLEVAVPDEAPAVPSLAEQVAAAASRKELEVLWEANAAVWSDNLTNLAQARAAELLKDAS